MDKDINIKSGGKIKYFDDETRININHETVFKKIDDELLNDDNYKAIHEKIKNSIATEEEKYKMNRYYFNKLLTNQEIINDNLFNALYNEFWDNRFKQHIIKNIKSEYINRFEFIKIKDDEYKEKESNETYTKDEIIIKGFNYIILTN